VADGGPRVGLPGVMAYDSFRNKRVLFTPGVLGEQNPYTLVWEWEGTNWVRQSPQLDPVHAAPMPLHGESIAYHSRRHQVIINNGNNNYGRPIETWAYDGASWTLLSQNAGFHPEENEQMVYDTARDALIEFGGNDTYGYYSRQTWELVDADLAQILRQPDSVVTGTNQSVRFSVTARGKPLLQYQWRRNGVNLTDGGNISGANSGTLTITNANPGTDLGTYDVVISNDCGSTVSATANLNFVSAALVLQLTQAANAMRLSWSSANAVLESAPQLSWPWLEVAGASSPYPVVMDQPARFFRLRQR
jgi:Immunoglobulin I-set domain